MTVCKQCGEDTCRCQIPKTFTRLWFLGGFFIGILVMISASHRQSPTVICEGIDAGAEVCDAGATAAPTVVNCDINQRSPLSGHFCWALTVKRSNGESGEVGCYAFQSELDAAEDRFGCIP